MKKDMENMKNEESFNTNVRNVLLSESLTVTVPIIIMFKSKMGLLYLFLGQKYRARGYPSHSAGCCTSFDWSKHKRK